MTLPPADRWTVGGSRRIYGSRWMSLDLVSVTPPGAPSYEHHVVRFPYEAVGTVVHHPDRGVLLLYRHRFITDTVGFEIPAGGVEPGEELAIAAAREVREETGWVIESPEVFLSCNASDGVSDQRFHFAYARAVEHVGEATDPHESTSVHWVEAVRLRDVIRAGEVPGCLSTTALLSAMAFGYLS